MSIGKFEPSYYHSKAIARHSHEDGTTEQFDTKDQSYFNGFSSLNKHHDDSISERKEFNEDALNKDKLQKYIHIEIHPNGGASVVRVYQHEIASLSSVEKEALARLFFEEVFSEEPENVAKHVIGIVQGAVEYMPELVSHLSATRPDLDIKVGGGGSYT